MAKGTAEGFDDDRANDTGTRWERHRGPMEPAGLPLRGLHRGSKGVGLFNHSFSCAGDRYNRLFRDAKFRIAPQQ